MSLRDTYIERGWIIPGLTAKEKAKRLMHLGYYIAAQAVRDRLR